ncbi:S-layer homology domain-containing protein [bacterium]|nr:S-layer homology domain-containing protein [bacterium]
MNIKKLTLAAILALGMVAGTQVSFAQEFTKECLSDDILAACPLSGCHPKVTPNTAKCPSCMNEKDDCSCAQPEPCETKCDDCDSKCDDCQPMSDSCNPCPPIAQCEEPSQPTCAVCPQPPEGKKFQQQVYAYPNAIYGKNQVVGERNNGLFLGDGSLAPLASGVPVASNNQCGCQNGAATGAAAPIGCMDNPSAINGIPVDNNPANIEGAGCPIQIHTNTSREILKKTYVPFDYQSNMTGGAAPLTTIFSDVPGGYWASCDINKLTENNVIAGYPDRTFKPALPVSRAEMASLIVKGFNLNDGMEVPQQHFSDVPKYHWANETINRAVANGLMSGYPNNTFHPDEALSRAEALTIMSKGVNCPMDECRAKEILSKYCDGEDVAQWAQIPIAKALDSGANVDMPNPERIEPNRDASRAEVASMLENIRVSLGYSKDDKTDLSSCGCEDKKAYLEEEQISTIPTLQLCFNDEITAKASHVGDQFSATTLDSVIINGIEFPAGSIVDGKVLEVIRPTKNCEGGLKLSFDTIKHDKCKAQLPQQILTAQVNKMNKPNAMIRAIEFPFTWTGGLLGNVGRTVGGAVVSASNAVEEVVSGFGVGTGELFQGQFRAAGRSYQDVGKAIVKAPVDTTRTALSGTLGLFQYSADEITYLVDPKGMRVSSVNPKEKITISFGCTQQ